MARVPADANAIEFRMDLAERPIPPAALLALDSRPVILDMALARGGRELQRFGRRVRAASSEECYAAGATVDVEHARGLLADARRFADRERVIASPHSPFSLPGDWKDEGLRDEAVARARREDGGRRRRRLRPGFRIAELQRDTGDPTVSIFPMGPASAPGRVLSALFGAALVYGPVERETAAGQIPIARPARRSTK